MSVLTQLGVKRTTPPEPDGSVPPLENGDRLTRAEFMRRYDAMPHLKKAELIEGVVYVSSPVRQNQHGRPHSYLIGWLFVYRAATPGVEIGDNSTVLLDLDNAPQPDGLLFIRPEQEGRVKVDEADYIEGAPDLIVEVAASSVSYDLHDKLDVYRRSGVREYVVHRVLEQKVDWFVLKQGQFESIVPSDDGLLRSTIFPGLWLDPAAVIRGDATTMFAVVQQGVNSPEHAEFVARVKPTT